jgi:hypothetical protein
VGQFEIFVFVPTFGTAKGRMPSAEAPDLCSIASIGYGSCFRLPEFAADSQ